MKLDTREESKRCNKNIRSFGRIKSRKLSDNKLSLLLETLPKYQSLEIDQIKVKQKKIILEIGFGFGDFLFNKAKNNSDIFFIGSEPHINGVANLLAMLNQNPLDNLYISQLDVRVLLQQIPNNFLDEIYILFPDPWPKSKHFKRRLITSNFLDEALATKLKNDGKIVIATDHDSYKTWILSNVLKSKNFLWMANKKEDWQNFPHDWIETKYQKKATLEMRKSIIIKLLKQHYV